MDYTTIANRKIEYSDDVYFLNYNEEFELWLDSKLVESFLNLRDVNNWLFGKYVNRRPARRVFVYTTYFNQIMEKYQQYNDIAFVIKWEKNNHTVPVDFQIFGGITYRESKYYLGTDETDKIDPRNYCELINNFHHSNPRHSFSTSLKELLLNDDMQEFGGPENVPLRVIKKMFENASLAPVIYSERNKEFTNVYCYDFDSAYIAHYYRYKFPYKFTYVGTNVNEKADEYFAQVKIKNLRAKNKDFLPLSVADRKFAVKAWYPSRWSKRPVLADEITISIFLKLEIPVIKKFYDYDEIIIEDAWKVELRDLPLSFRERVKEMYLTKETLKERKEIYADKKVLLNRIHGFMITSKEDFGKPGKIQMYTNTPAQIGFYTIALQRRMMCNLIDKIGLENIVSAHTDSIKTKGDFQTIIDKFNERYGIVGFEKLGRLESEGIMEKVIYFSHIRAKYIMDGEFKIKHGGILKQTAKQILTNYTYDTLSAKSKYGFVKKMKFERKDDRDVLSMEFDIRAFSEEGDDE